MSEFIEVKAGDLVFGALDWAVAQVEKLKVELTPPNYGEGTALVFLVGDEGLYRPSTDWNIGGPLIKKYGVMLSPPASLVHRNYGNYDKRNGYYESGVWSTTIFAKERKHRRAGFSHESDPLIPAMRAIVQFELGDVVSVPAELMP